MHPLLARAQRDGTPLIDGEMATFVWHGTSAPQLIGDFNGWGWGEAGPITLAQADAEVWTYSLHLPREAYIEYTYTPDYQDKQRPRLPDPFNKRRITNGMGKFNQFFDMPAAQHVPAWRGDLQGTVTQHLLTHDYLLAGGKRDVWLYKPPTRKHTPLLVVYDGKDYLTRARVLHIIEHLVNANQLPPLSVALVQNGRAARFVEYNASETTLMMVTELVLPLAQHHLRLLDPHKQHGAFGVLGASMGGLMALYTGLRLPNLFGHIISQSGAFQFGFQEVPPLVTELVHSKKPRLRIWQDVGQFEWLLDTNRAFNQVLHERGYTVTYKEYAGGHNYTSWRDQLPSALRAVFGNGGS
jgi:enterochelin esterase-like enzyme